MRVAIVGGGNFGTAIGNIIAANGFPTVVWMRDAELAAECQALRENRRYLPGHRLEPRLEAMADLARAVKDSDLIFMTVPSASFRSVCRELAALIHADSALISATKGIEAAGFHLMSQVLEEECGARVGVISGPNFAEEIALGHYTGTVVASRDAALCEAVQTVLRSETLRVYSSTDVFGVELGGALKNIYAIICGMADALAVGQNTIAMLITRSLAEMSRFAVSLGANPFTFLGLSGVGDLLATCTSPLSRNFQLGHRLAEGKSLTEAMDELGKLAEGVNTLEVVNAKRQALGVYMPLVAGLHRVVFDGAPIADVVAGLMTAEQGVDVEFAAPTTWSYQAP